MSLRVLIVDDHAVMCEGLATLMTGAGMQVVGSAGNGRDAVRMVHEQAPDIVIMDISMPEMNGFEATTDICSRFPAVQVVVLSMYSSTAHVHQALAAGAMGYVLKASAGTEVVEAVRAVCAGRRYISPAIGDVGTVVPGSGPLAALSARERQVLQLVVEGKSSAAIAQRIHLSPKTVETYRSRLKKKLGIDDVATLVKFAIQHGLTPPE